MSEEKKKVELIFINNDLVNHSIKIEGEQNPIALRTRSRYDPSSVKRSPYSSSRKSTLAISTPTSKRARPSSKVTPSSDVITPKSSRRLSHQKPTSCKKRIIQDSSSTENIDYNCRTASPERSNIYTIKDERKVTPIKIYNKQFTIRCPPCDIDNIIISPPIKNLDLSDEEIFIQSPRKRNTSQKENIATPRSTPKISKFGTPFSNCADTPKTESLKKRRRTICNTPKSTTSKSLLDKFKNVDTPKERRKEIRKGIFQISKKEEDDWIVDELSVNEVTDDDCASKSKESERRYSSRIATARRTKILKKQVQKLKQQNDHHEEDSSVEQSDDDDVSESHESRESDEGFSSQKTRSSKKREKSSRATNTSSRSLFTEEFNSEEESEAAESDDEYASELDESDESDEHTLIEETTPKRKKSKTLPPKIRRSTRKKTQTEEFCSEESVDAKSDDDDTDEAEECGEPAKKSKASIEKTSYKFRERKRIDYRPMMVLDSEQYFEKKSQKSNSSKNTLSSLSLPDVSESEMNKLIAKNYVKHDVKKLTEKYRREFTKWFFYLKEGFNLLMYGVGSKINVIKLFQNEMLKDCDILTINGFDPAFSLNEFFTMLLMDIFQKTYCPANKHEALAAAKEALLEYKIPVFIIINNIDGTALKGNKQQTMLSKIAELPFIHIIASIDHINAPLLWGNNRKSSFNFLWLDVTTFCPYTTEISFSSSLEISNLGSDSSLSTLNNIFKTMDPKTQELFKFILKCYLDNRVKKDFKGILVSDLHRLAKSNFTVTSMHALKRNLESMMKYDFIALKHSYINILIEKKVLATFYKQQFGNNGNF